MRLKCIIVDDESLALDLLESYVSRTPFLEFAGRYPDASSAMAAVGRGGVDLAFLDINMPGVNGVEFSKMLPPKVKVIFTTAYDRYAIECFRRGAVDYLLKPVSYEEFLHACSRALRQTEDCAGEIFIKSGLRTERITLDEILYAENRKDYVDFHLEGRTEPLSSLMNISALEEKLPSGRFMRVHRSFIVNLDKVRTVERGTIVFGRTRIPVSDSYREAFAAFMEKHTI